MGCVAIMPRRQRCGGCRDADLDRADYVARPEMIRVT